MAVTSEQVDDMYTQIVLGRSKADYGPLDPEASELWDRIAAEVDQADERGDIFQMLDPEWPDLPPWVAEAPQPRPARQAPTAGISAHLAGRHDQRKHGRGRGGGRAGMGDVELTPGMVAEMQGGSAAAHIIQRPDGTYGFSPERQALHDDIINSHLEGKVPSDNPTYHVLGGGPAAGKSTFVDSDAGARLRDESSLLVNADDMKAELPEYSQMLRDGDPTAAHFTHEESSYLAKRLQAAGFENRLNVTLDGTGDSSSDKLRGKIATARNAGYRVEGHYVTVPTDVAVDRANARGERTGRVVPESVVRGTHSAVSRTAADTYSDFDAFDLYDTSGTELNHVLSYRDGSTTVNDQAAWDSFLAKGSEG